MRATRIRILRIAVAAMVLAAGGVLVTASPASALTNTDYGWMSNLESALCLTPNGGQSGSGVVVVQWSCDSHPARRWKATGPVSGWFGIRNLNSTLCLGTQGGSTANGTIVFQYACTSDTSRQWRRRAVSVGYQYQLRKSPTKCLTIDGGSHALNQRAVIWPCDTNLARLWTT